MQRRNRKSKSKSKNSMKNPFKSKTIWGLIIMVVSSVLSRFGVETPKEEITETVQYLDNSWEAILQVVQIVGDIVGGILIIWGRKTAKAPISLNPLKGAGTALFLFVMVFFAVCLMSCQTAISPSISPSVGLSKEGDTQGCVRFLGVGPLDLKICADKANPKPE